MSKYKTDVDRIAAICKALSSPQRLRIFLKLVDCCAPKGCCGTDTAGMRRCVGELGADLGLAASTVSHHVKELRRAGIMEVERRGQRIECWINGGTLKIIIDFFGGTGALKAAVSKGGTRDRKSP